MIRRTFMLVLVANLAGAAHGQATHRILEPWSNVFAGKDAAFTVGVDSADTFQGGITWRLAAGSATVARGESPVDLAAGLPVHVRVPLPIPNVKPGIVLAMTLTVALQRQGEDGNSTLEKQLWAFPEDPFAGRDEWLKNLRVQLFDPEGNTQALFEKCNIPFNSVANVNALETLEGFLIIGEGVSFDEYRGLPDMMADAASRGMPVLCLAPGQGTMEIPGAAGSALPKPESLRLEGPAFTQRIDKRIDSGDWYPGIPPGRAGIVLKSDRQRVIGEVEEGATAWPWLIATYGGTGHLVICGQAIVANWEGSPSPRWLLVGLLDWLDTTREEMESKETIP